MAKNSSTYPYLIGMSGPPRAGKDTIGLALAEVIRKKNPTLDVATAALSLPLRMAVYAVGGMVYTREHYEAQKDVPQGVFGGATIREAIISLAEDHLRPKYGVGFFARSMVSMFASRAFMPNIIIVTDVGFSEEVDEFRAAYGADNVVYPQIIRQGCTFEGDSRSFVGDPLRRTTIINEGSIDDVALRLYSRLTNQFHWNLG